MLTTFASSGNSTERRQEEVLAGIGQTAGKVEWTSVSEEQVRMLMAASQERGRLVPVALRQSRSFNDRPRSFVGGWQRVIRLADGSLWVRRTDAVRMS